MKLLIVSDSHGWIDNMRRAVERESPDQIIHLGDYVRDAESLRREFPDIPLVSVPGNCDGATRLPEELLLRVGEVRLLLCHGHRYRVKESYYPASLAARQAGADGLFFGHTHRPYCEYCDGLWMLNPGSCGYPGQLNYGVAMVENGRLMCYNVSE